MEQFILPLQLNPQATFANFVGEKNQVLLAQLQMALQAPEQERLFFLWGGEGSGRTHVLQALCHAAVEQQSQAFYLSLNQHTQLDPMVLQDLEHLDIVCLDDIHAIAGQADWEEALFHCYNRLFEQRKMLVLTGDAAPAQSTIALPDLRSRLAAAYVSQLQSLTDAEKLSVLQLNANALGLVWTQEIGEFILQRCARNLTELMDILDKLSVATLQQQRRLTIPFIKQVLGI